MANLQTFERSEYQQVKPISIARFSIAWILKLGWTPGMPPARSTGADYRGQQRGRAPAAERERLAREILDEALDWSLEPIKDQASPTSGKPYNRVYVERGGKLRPLV
jgi:hypothetical protein